MTPVRYVATMTDRRPPAELAAGRVLCPLGSPPRAHVLGAIPIEALDADDPDPRPSHEVLEGVGSVDGRTVED